MKIRIVLSIFYFISSGYISVLSAETQEESDSIAVYLFLSETCPICQSTTLEMRKIQEIIEDKPITMAGIFPNEKLSTFESRKQFGRRYKLKFPLLSDSLQKMTLLYDVQVTPEVVMINLKTKEILYRGLIDNSYVAIGKRRQVVNEHYLLDALEATLNQQEIQVKQTTPVGCFIQIRHTKQ
jgi:peroxiredoxin